MGEHKSGVCVKQLKIGLRDRETDKHDFQSLEYFIFLETVCCANTNINKGTVIHFYICCSNKKIKALHQKVKKATKIKKILSLLAKQTHDIYFGFSSYD